MSEDDDVIKTFSRELPVNLNDHELQQYGRMLAEKVKEEELAVEQKALRNKEMNGKIQGIRNEIKRIADARAKGQELRPVKCIERLRNGVVEIVRTDVNEVVDVRPADMRDLQTSMDLDMDDTDEETASAEPPDVGPGPDDGANDGTGTVRSQEGERVGEVISSSFGDGVFVGDGEELEDEHPPSGDDEEEGPEPEEPTAGRADSPPSKLSRARIVKRDKAKSKSKGKPKSKGR